MEGLQERLERSQQVILELEESSRRTGQRDSDISEMMRKMREASEVELKRFMEEAEAKHNLDVRSLFFAQNSFLNSWLKPWVYPAVLSCPYVKTSKSRKFLFNLISENRSLVKLKSAAIVATMHSFYQFLLLR